MCTQKYFRESHTIFMLLLPVFVLSYANSPTSDLSTANTYHVIDFRSWHPCEFQSRLHHLHKHPCSTKCITRQTTNFSRNMTKWSRQRSGVGPHTSQIPKPGECSEGGTEQENLFPPLETEPPPKKCWISAGKHPFCLRTCSRVPCRHPHGSERFLARHHSRRFLVTSDTTPREMADCRSNPCKIVKLGIDFLQSRGSLSSCFISLVLLTRGQSIYDCCNCLGCLCEGRPNLRLYSTWRSLLLALSSFTSHSAVVPPPWFFSTFHSQEEERSFCFPPPTRSPLQAYSFAHLLSPLTKSLFRLDAAENHMACDITGAGSEERGMVEGWGGGWGWLARSLCSDVSRKALWEARWGGESRAGWKLYPFLSNFTPTWIIRDWRKVRERRHAPPRWFVKGRAGFFSGVTLERRCWITPRP